MVEKKDVVGADELPVQKSRRADLSGRVFYGWLRGGICAVGRRGGVMGGELGKVNGLGLLAGTEAPGGDTHSKYPPSLFQLVKNYSRLVRLY